MTISAKDTKELKYKAIAHIVIGVVAFVSIYMSVDKIDNIFVFFALVLAIFIVAKGLFHALDIKYCKQPERVEIDIRNNIFYLNDQHFPLAKGYLYFELRECGKNIAVSLYLENEKQNTTIFPKLIFSPKEFESFLKLIAPYRKIDFFPWEKYSTYPALFVCNRGFIVGGRILFYDEVQSFEWETGVFYRVGKVHKKITIEIRLKNGEILSEFLLDSSATTQAKIAYIEHRIHGKPIGEVLKNKKTAGAFRKILKILETNECEML